jgi:dienelactone hydrolase
MASRMINQKPVFRKKTDSLELWDALGMAHNLRRVNFQILFFSYVFLAFSKVFEKLIYDGAAHAFHNDTGANYNANAAKDAWAKTVAWLDKYVN